MPLERTQHRQYFRLVCGKVSKWFGEHSTANPTGTRPPPDVEIVFGNKFAIFDSRCQSKRMPYYVG